MEASTPTQPFDTIPGGGAGGAPTQPMLAAALGQQCSACGGALAPDQLYCLQCGERRGPSRVAALQAQVRSAAPVPTAGGGSATVPAARSRMSAGNTLIAGVGTLLLAMGIGVLIGRSGDSSTSSAKPASAVQVVTVPGAVGANGAASTTPQGAASSRTPSKAAKAAASSTPAPAGGAVVTPKKNAPPPTKVVTVGSPGSGPGYQHGHFTGNFFGQ